LIIKHPNSTRSFVQTPRKPAVNRPAQSEHPRCKGCKEPMAQEWVGTPLKLAKFHFCITPFCSFYSLRF